MSSTIIVDINLYILIIGVIVNSLNITNGVSETEFAPNSLITREQMATMMTRVLNQLGIKTNADIKEKFADNGEISDWAQNSVYFMN